MREYSGLRRRYRGGVAGRPCGPRTGYQVMQKLGLSFADLGLLGFRVEGLGV